MTPEAHLSGFRGSKATKELEAWTRSLGSQHDLVDRFMWFAQQIHGDNEPIARNGCFFFHHPYWMFMTLSLQQY